MPASPYPCPYPDMNLGIMADHQHGASVLVYQKCNYVFWSCDRIEMLQG